MRVVLVSPIIALTYVNLFVEIAALENDSPDRLQSEPVRSRFSYRYGDLQKNSGGLACFHFWNCCSRERRVNLADNSRGRVPQAFFRRRLVSIVSSALASRGAGDCDPPGQTRDRAHSGHRAQTGVQHRKSGIANQVDRAGC